MTDIFIILFWTAFTAIMLGLLIFLAPFIADQSDYDVTFKYRWQEFKSDTPHLIAILLYGALLGFIISTVQVTDGFVSAFVMTVGALYFFWRSSRLVFDKNFAKTVSDGQFQVIGLVMLMSIFFLITGLWRMIFA